MEVAWPAPLGAGHIPLAPGSLAKAQPLAPYSSSTSSPLPPKIEE